MHVLCTDFTADDESTIHIVLCQDDPAGLGSY